MPRDIVWGSKHSFFYTSSIDVNLMRLDLQITCRPPVIVSKWNPLWSYWVSERWEAERSGLCQSSVKVREQQGPPAHINMHSHNMCECSQTHTHMEKTSTHNPSIHSLTWTCPDIPVRIESQHQQQPSSSLCYTCQVMSNTEVASTEGKD